MSLSPDEMLRLDRVVRKGLNVRPGQSIESRAREILAHKSLDTSQYTRRRVRATEAIIALRGWDGLELAARLLTQLERVDP